MIENHRFWTLGTFKQLSWKNQISIFFSISKSNAPGLIYTRTYEYIDVMACVRELTILQYRPPFGKRYFQIHLSYRKGFISIQVSLGFATNIPTLNKVTLVQIMAWGLTVNKPIPESIIV